MISDVAKKTKQPKVKAPLLYKVLGPLYPVLRRIAPRYVTTSLQLGHAMIRTAGGGMPRHVLATAHINQLAAS